MQIHLSENITIGAISAFIGIMIMYLYFSDDLLILSKSKSNLIIKALKMIFRMIIIIICIALISEFIIGTQHRGQRFAFCMGLAVMVETDSKSFIDFITNLTKKTIKNIFKAISEFFKFDDNDTKIF